MIYGVNGTEFKPGGDEKYIQFTAAIARAEAVKGGGTMVLNIRREGKLIEVPVEPLVPVPDATTMKLYIDDEPFFAPTADLLEFEREFE